MMRRVRKSLSILLCAALCAALLCACAAWWKLLARVGAGEDIAQAVQGFPALEA